MKNAPQYVASLHRFHDKAALAIRGSRETLYLTPQEARELGAALVECAANIESANFLGSNYSGRDVMPSAAFYEGSPDGRLRKPELDELNARQSRRVNKESKI